MNKIVAAMLALNFLNVSAMAGDITHCSGGYIVTASGASPENQTKVQSALVWALGQRMININKYIPSNVNYFLTANSSFPGGISETVKFLESIKQVPGTTVECDQDISMQ